MEYEYDVGWPMIQNNSQGLVCGVSSFTAANQSWLFTQTMVGITNTVIDEMEHRPSAVI